MPNAFRSGRRVAGGAREPLALTDLDVDLGWYVVAGTVDVFVTPRERGGHEAGQLGARDHLLSRSAGQALFAVVLPGDTTADLVAVLRPDTVLVESHTRGPAAELAPLRSQWSRDLFDGLALDEPGVDPQDQGIALGQALDRRLAASRAARTAGRLAKDDVDKHAMRSGLGALTGILDRQPGRLNLVAPGESPLLTVYRRLAAVQRLPATAPPPDTGAADELSAICRASGVRSRPVTLTGAWWRHDNGPLLGYRADSGPDAGQPVALIPDSGRRYRLDVPGGGKPVLVTEAVAAGLSSRAYMLYRPLPDGPLRLADLVRQILPALRAEAPMLMLTAAAGAALALAVPLATGALVNTLIPSADTPQIVALGLALCVAAVAAALFQLTHSFSIMRLEGRISRELSPALWDRLLSLPTAFFRRYPAGDLALRAEGLDAGMRLVGGTTVSTTLTAAFSVFSYALMLAYSPGLTLVATVVLVAAAAVMGIGARVQLRHHRASLEIQRRLGGAVLEYISGITTLRVAGAEARAFSRWATTFGRQQVASIHARTVENAVLAMTAALPVTGSAVLFAAIILSGSSLSAGSFLAFIAAFTQVLVALLGLGSALRVLVQVLPYLEGAQPILSERPESDSVKANPGQLTGDIELSHVTFRYDPAGPAVLDDVSLTIRPGSFVAFVGPSGSGKSTLGRLLLGFEQPEAGGVFYDGQDLAGLDIRSVRRQLGVVLQSVQLLPGDILSNIVGSTSLTVDDAWLAARQCGLESDIRRMPMGLSTYVMEGGSTLSGGQRQRLLIARAMVTRPHILLLDEATSALDNTTQRIVSDSLNALQATRIVIAHRLSTVQAADWIYYVDHGRIVESGTFEELMALSGKFAAQARRQLT